jgi:hypothetical protein
MNVAARENEKQSKYRHLSDLFLVKRGGTSAQGDIRAINGETAKVYGVSKYCVYARLIGKVCTSCEASEQVVSWRL